MPLPSRMYPNELMRTTRTIAFLLIGLWGFSAGTGQAQTYTLEESVVSGAGGTVQADGQTLTATVGQPSPGGRAEAESFVLYSGHPSPFFGVRAITLEVPLSDPGAQPSGQPVTVAVNVTNQVAELDAVTLRYRSGGADSFSSVAMTPDGSGTTFEADLPADAVSDQGIAYYITATDVEGNQARVPAQGVFSFPVQIDEPGIVKPNGQPSGTTQTAYRLISVPIDLDQQDPTDVLGDDISFLASASTYEPSEARFFEPIGQTVSEFPRTNDMTAGKAFWLIVRDGSDPFDSGAGSVFEIGRPFQIDLDEGWNFIGTPFNFPVPAENLRTEDGQDIVLRSYGSSGYNAVSNPVSTMQPFQGYAVFSESETTLFIHPDEPPSTSGQDTEASKANWAQRTFDPVWHIRIVGRAAKALDADNVAGVMHGASAGQDALDWPEPPGVSSRLSVAFPRPEWSSASTHFSADIRPEPMDGATWTFEVKTDASDPVMLTFEGVRQIPNGWEAWLLDEKLKVTRHLQRGAQYTLDNPIPDETRSFQLLVGSSDYIEKRLESEEALPGQYALDGVFPNPTSGRASVRFGVPQEEEVTIRVYDVLGRRVATLLDEVPREAGYHVLQWDGRGSGGAPLASGVYFVRMRAGDFMATQKVVRVR